VIAAACYPSSFRKVFKLVRPHPKPVPSFSS
jgi:hypothetical protein